MRFYVQSDLFFFFTNEELGVVRAKHLKMKIRKKKMYFLCSNVQTFFKVRGSLT